LHRKDKKKNQQLSMPDEIGKKLGGIGIDQEYWQMRFAMGGTDRCNLNLMPHLFMISRH